MAKTNKVIAGERTQDDTKCEACGERKWKAQRCPGDGGSHHHGAIHTRNGGLMRLCDECYPRFKEEWGEHILAR